MSVNWSDVANHLDAFATQSRDDLLDEGQKATVARLGQSIRAGRRAALLADEVGMGKTRIAVALVQAVRAAGGRSAIVLPAGLGAQWQAELRQFNPNDKTLLPLRSYHSFIEGYSRDTDWHWKGHKKWLADRKLQRDLPERSWADEDVLMISHSFANMRFSGNTDDLPVGWRHELLTAVKSSFKAGAKSLDLGGLAGYDSATYRAAEVIAKAIRVNDLGSVLSGHQASTPSAKYRDRILPLIGYALGRFDLIIIDEAHKSRGEASSLSRILGPLTWESKDPFRFGMTATPVEIDAGQWLDTLSRIHGRDDKTDTSAIEALRDTVETYTKAVTRLQVEALDSELVSTFQTAASAFKSALDPHVLRRDKRDDAEYSGYFTAHGDYRNVEDISVSPDTHADCFTRDWLRRFCAAEALSMLPHDNPRVKRMRLSVAQGHSLDAVANQLTSEKSDEEKAEIATEVGTNPAPAEQATTAGFWLDMLGKTAPDIYDHPALLAVTREIEGFTARGEKVLVFGRYIKPLQALTRYLDARAMLQALASGGSWPGETIAGETERAVKAALRDPALSARFSHVDDVKVLLAERYRERQNQRNTALQQRRTEVEDLAAAGDRNASLLARLLAQKESDADRRFDNAHLYEALESRRGKSGEEWSGASMVGTFTAILADLARGDETEQPSEETLLDRLQQYLDDYSGREGSFARLMYGATGAQARRNLQSAFNRKHANPRVLLAQSRVGREGLNLHEECRRVILLHAEWNPAIVEQQIGRVDRKNSRWLKDYRTGVTDDGAPPRIHIHPVVMRGTYDDRNWQVLKSRWTELRAQLHGEVLPTGRKAGDDNPELQALIDQVVAATPNFSPLRKQS